MQQDLSKLFVNTPETKLDRAERVEIRIVMLMRRRRSGEKEETRSRLLLTTRSVAVHVRNSPISYVNWISPSNPQFHVSSRERERQNY